MRVGVKRLFGRVKSHGGSYRLPKRRGRFYHGRWIALSLVAIIAVSVAVPLFTIKKAQAWWTPSGSQWAYRKQISFNTTPIFTPSSAPVLDAQTTASNTTNGATSLSWSHTVGNQTNRGLFVQIQVAGNAAAAGAVSSVTYNGLNLQQATWAANSCNGVANQCRTEIWYMAAPAVGTANVVVTTAANRVINASALSFYNVNQAYPYADSIWNSDTNATVGSSHSTRIGGTSANYVVVDSIVDDATTITAAGGQTQVSNQCCTAGVSGASSYAPGSASGTTTMSWQNGGGGTGTYAIAVILINGTGASVPSLTNFPAMVKLDSSTIDYTKLQSAGQDLRFTDADGLTPLSYEIEKWDTAGTSVVWVKVPTLDLNSTGDSIWMYYGNSSVADAQDKPGVWDSSFKGVYHLKESGTGAVGEYKDSTSNANNARGGNGTAGNVPARITTGAIGDAQRFDGTNDNITINNTALFDATAPYTLDAWIKPTNCGESNSGSIIEKTGIVGLFLCASSGGNDYGLNYYGSNTVTSTSFNWITMGSWQHIVVSYDGAGVVKFYVNGYMVASYGVAAVALVVPSSVLKRPAPACTRLRVI